jgi:SWI/SNF-related matrix-associated actin-dependent regulator of chromatin subfamily A member 5
LKYLVSQADIFRHFVSGVSPQKQSLEQAKTSKSSKRRMTEKEEDELLMEAEVDGHQETTRLTTQPYNIKGTMRPYQLEGLNFLIGLYEHGLNGILADEMGLGKTLQTISLLAFLRGYRHINGPHLIIVPKSTIGNWALEFEKWCPSFNILRFHGNQDDRANLREQRLLSKDFDVCLTTYEVAIKEKNSLRRFTWRYVIIDEAHRIKNENSILSQVVRTFESQNRLLLTGTPLQNNLHELWALLNFLLPDIFASAGLFLCFI